ncbi:MAG TPA: SpoIID/LytB domain-containing protein [Tepidisphaeraceae bacterium]|jgi:stage II sporulation protein D|nr:SpoIID/LytB domain-containing protein [Tepidisphaeraceae bacterium]
MGSAHRDVRRAIALARILTRLLLDRLRYSITLWSILAGCLCLVGLLIIAPWGCTPKTQDSAVPISGRLIRVRLMQGQEQVTLKPATPFVYRSADSAERQVNVAPNTLIPVRLDDAGWHAGNLNLGKGELILRPTVEGQLRINDRTYRGQYRLVPIAGGKFDVINDVDLDDYLKSVLSKELYANWHEETYKAQAIAARTYSLYEKHARSEDRYWDLHADVRSQAYGGMDSETPRSRKAVDETAGIVLAIGADGNERIFKAYYSSTCGGVTQASTVFNEPPLQPLSEQYVGALCSASPKYTWGPIVVNKDELSQRIKKWFINRQRPQIPALPIRAIDIEIRNRFGRPMRFGVIDARGMRFSLMAEELRWAVNTDAAENQKLPSSFVENIINDYDKIHFVGGRGFGHGMGMCQWCAEARARAGMRHEDILIAAYPGARLMRAY